MKPMKEFALYYARKGIPVFPLNGKKPFLGSHGFKDATTDEEQIKNWWDQHPDANIGIRTGKESGLVVLDMDEHPEKNQFGIEAVEALEKKLGPLPKTWEAESGNGGRHKYAKYPSGHTLKKTESALAYGVDTRADDSYIVAPPSVHPDTGKRYRWINNPEDTELAEIPEAWIEYYEQCQNKGKKKSGQTQESQPTDDLLNKVSQGKRNSTVFKYGASLRSQGIKPTRIFDLMVSYNDEHCNPPLPEKEIVNSYDSILKYPAGTPIDEILKKEDPTVHLTKVSEIAKKPIEWLIPGYIPQGVLTIVGADGGAGKTSLWCNLAAAISTGTPSILEHDRPVKGPRKPQDVLFFSGEDSVATVLRQRLENAGADLNRVYCIDYGSPDFHKISFNSVALKKLISEKKPALCIFDPLQSFIPMDVNMSSRNAMRQTLTPLLGLGEEYGTSFLIVMHTNKRMIASGRDRFADSADMWDIARSALMVGYTKEKGVRYISQEKSNYGAMSETVLFTIDGEGKPFFQGTTDKRDADFQHEKVSNPRSSPVLEDATDTAMEILEDKEEMSVKDFNQSMEDQGFAKKTISNAKRVLKKDGKITLYQVGSNKDRQWFIKKA